MPSWQRLAEMLPAGVALSNDPLLGLRRKITELCLAPAKLLEIGCGSGLLAGWFEDYGYSVYALDNDLDVLNTAKARLTAEKIGMPKFFHGDAFKAGAGMVKYSPFAACYSQGLLEHFTDAEIYELLLQQTKLSSLTVFSVPSENYPRKEKGDERFLPLAHWWAILEKFNETHEPTLAYYGRDIHLMGVLKCRKT